MLSEEEAKKKWCPHVQVSVSTGIDGTEQDDNRNSMQLDFSRQPICIASKCMAWRWCDEYDALNVQTDEVRPLGIGFNALEDDEMKVPRYENGYCGLSGPAS
jgi:hypothetical protein